MKFKYSNNSLITTSKNVTNTYAHEVINHDRTLASNCQFPLVLGKILIISMHWAHTNLLITNKKINLVPYKNAFSTLFSSKFSIYVHTAIIYGNIVFKETRDT